MAVQISRYIHPEIPAQASVWSGEAGAGKGVSPAGCAEGVSDRGGTPDGRSRAYAHLDSAQVCGVERDWVFEGQERDSCGTTLLETGEKLRGAAIVGAGFLCGYGGPEGRSDPALHSGTRG